MSKKRTSKYKILLLFFCSYMLIMIVPFVSIFYSYKRSEKIVYQLLEDRAVSLLDQTSKVIDTRFREIDNLITYLSFNTEVKSMASIKNPYIQKNTVYPIYYFGKGISAYGINNSFIDTFYLYFPSGDIIVSPNDIYLNSQTFYDSFFSIENMDYSKWQALMKNAPLTKKFFPANQVYINNSLYTGTNEAFYCIQGLYPYQNSTQVSIILLIRTEQVLNLLQTSSLSDGSYSAIIDDTGSVLVSTDNTLDWTSVVASSGENQKSDNTIDGQEIYVFKTESAYNNWKYVSVLPQSYVMHQLANMQKFHWLALIVSLVISTLLASAISYFYSKPIAEAEYNLRNYFGNKNKEKIGLNYIRTKTIDLINSHIDINQKMQEHLPLLKNAFLHSLLRGELPESDITAMCAQMNINFPYGNFIVISIRITNPTSDDLNADDFFQTNKNKTVLKHLITEAFSGALLCDHSVDRLALILNANGFDTTFFNWLEQQIQKVAAIARAEYQVDTLFAIGETMTGIENINRSFFQSETALQYKALDGEKTHIYFRDIPRGYASFYFPRNLENKLENLIRKGDWTQTVLLLNEIFCENLSARKLSANSLLFFIHNICLTLTKAAESMHLQEEQYEQIQKDIFSISSLLTIEKQCERIKHVTEMLCNIVLSKRKSNNHLLAQRILAYINDNYENPEISLNFIARQFSISEVYLSQFFKDQIGENFFSYLENIRLEAAKQYLLSTSMSIGEISVRTGYSSTAVFRSAFKRRNGISPSQLRKNAL